MDNRNRYLSLLKETLTFSLWPEPLVPVETFNYKRPWFKRTILRALSAFADIANQLVAPDRLVLAVERSLMDEQRRLGMHWPLFAHTMLGLERLDNLQNCIESVYHDDIEGDFIETGVWRGGGTIFMKALVEAYNDSTRRVFVADSFEGLPKPNAKVFPHDRADTLYQDSFLSITLEEVTNNFRRYGLLDERVIFIKGFFADTMAKAPIEKLSILRLDGDMYESTFVVLSNLYPKLSVGGYCIIDDWALPACQQAVKDYLAAHDIEVQILEIDSIGAFWRK